MSDSKKIMRRYDNPNNGGHERVYREDDKYYISSDWGNGFFGRRQVSKSEMQTCLKHTKAPQDVADAILG